MTFYSTVSNVCSAQRSRSNTPLQALTLWNDRVFMECARNLGMRLATTTNDTTSADGGLDHRVQQAFLICLSRYATDDEASAVTAFYQRQIELLGANEEAVKEIISNLELPDGVEPVEIAAWVATARVMLNLDEFITRE